MLVSKKEMQLIVRPESSLELSLHRPHIIGDRYSTALMFYGENKWLMHFILDSSINLILIDIPYFYKGLKRFIQEAKKKTPSHRRNLKGWEKTMVYIYSMTHGCDLHWLVKEIIRVQPDNKVNAYIWTDKKQGKKLTKLFAKHGVHLSTILTWTKTNHAPADHAYTSEDEYCYYFKQHVTIKGNTYTRHKNYLYPSNHAEINHLGLKVPEVAKHETIKPLFMNCYFIYNSSKPGDWVLDFFAGSGTSGVASEMLHRNFIGMEHLYCYYKLACERLSQPRSSARKLIKYEIDRQKRMQKPATVTTKATNTMFRDTDNDTEYVDKQEAKYQKHIDTEKHQQFKQKKQEIEAKCAYRIKILAKKYNEERPVR